MQGLLLLVLVVVCLPKKSAGVVPITINQQFSGASFSFEAADGSLSVCANNAVELERLLRLSMAFGAVVDLLKLEVVGSSKKMKPVRRG